MLRQTHIQPDDFDEDGEDGDRGEKFETPEDEEDAARDREDQERAERKILAEKRPFCEWERDEEDEERFRSFDAEEFGRYKERIDALRKAIERGKTAPAKRIYRTYIGDTNVLVDVIFSLIEQALAGRSADHRLLRRIAGTLEGSTKIADVNPALLSNAIRSACGSQDRGVPDKLRSLTLIHQEPVAGHGRSESEQYEEDADIKEPSAPGDGRRGRRGAKSDDPPPQLEGKALERIKRTLEQKGGMVMVNYVVFKNARGEQETMQALQALTTVSFCNIIKAARYADVQVAADMFFVKSDYDTKRSLRQFALQQASCVLPDNIDEWPGVPRNNSWALFAIYIFGDYRLRRRYREVIEEYLRREQNLSLRMPAVPQTALQ